MRPVAALAGTAAAMLHALLIVVLALGIGLIGIIAGLFSAGYADLDVVNGEALVFQRRDEATLVLVQFSVSGAVFNDKADRQFAVRQLQRCRDASQVLRCHLQLECIHRPVSARLFA